MKRVGPFVEVIHHQVYPHRVRSCSDRELVFVPFVAGKIEEGRWRVALRFPGGAVEEGVGDIVVFGEFLDLGVHDVSLVGVLGKGGKYGL